MDRPVNQSESPLEILRRLENLLRAGTVEQVRHGKPARCRIRTGDLLTNWVPWMAGRAGRKRRQWWPPEIGEQCLLLAPGGDLLNAVAMPGLHSDKAPQGSESETECRTDWSETDHMSHDSNGGHLVIECVGSITFKVGDTVLTLTPQGATVVPDLVGGGHVSLVQHVHGEVRKGGDTSGAPV